jgi:hypothetical protein
MIDYKIKYKLWVPDDIELSSQTIITVEEFIPDEYLLEDVLFEKLKDYLENDEVELVEFDELKQTEQANLYQITDDDVYYEDEYIFKGVIGNKAEEFMGRSMEDTLEHIRDNILKQNKI